MKIAYFDCQFGAAGDMLLGALLDAGLNEKQWLSELAKIALPRDSYAIEIKQVQRQTLAAKKLDVIVKSGQSINKHHEQENDHGHNHSGHSHEHSHGHNHSHHGGEDSPEDSRGQSREHSDHIQDNVDDRVQAKQNTSENFLHTHPHTHMHTHTDSHSHGIFGAESHEHHEHGFAVAMTHVQAIINDSDISAKAKNLAHKIVSRLGDCERSVHGMDPGAVYFHEVGAIDSIIDIVGFAIAYDILQIEESYVSAIPLGRGYVNTAHGYFPVPSPAVANLLAQIKAPTSNYDIDFECLTPTGAAILAEVCQNWGKMPRFDQIDLVGYGAGTKQTSKHPNVCRVMVGELF